MKALVLGGTGYVGQELIRRLAAAGEEVAFTWNLNSALACELPGLSLQVDLCVPGAVEGLFARLDAAGFVPDALACCAGTTIPPRLVDNTVETVSAAFWLYGGAALAACQALAARPTGGLRNVVLLTALVPGQSIPVSAPFALAHGGLGALTMALGHELGPQGFRVNAVALGLLDGGAARDVAPSQVELYKRFAALHRPGTAAEVAATVLWLMRENRVLNGRVLASNGGV